MEIKNLVALNGVAARKFHCITSSKVTRQLYTDRCPTGTLGAKFINHSGEIVVSVQNNFQFCLINVSINCRVVLIQC